MDGLEQIRLRLLDYMARRNFSVREVAEEVGVSHATISHIRNRKRVPEPETLRKLGPVLGVDIDTLLRWAGHLPPRDEARQPLSRDDLLDRLQAVDAIEVPVYEITASASPSRDLFSDIPADYHYLPRRGRYRKGRVKSIRVKGDCMEPVLHDGDEVFVDTGATGADWEAGDVVLALVGDALHIKELRSRDDGWELAPANGEPPIRVLDEVHVLGTVIGVWTELELLRRLRRRTG